MAMINGKTTPNDDDSFTFIIAYMHAICTIVNKLVTFLETVPVHLFFGATEVSSNNPLARSHNSKPWSDVSPRYRNTPLRTGSGTWASNARGLTSRTQAPISACMAAPETRFSIVPRIDVPSSSITDRDRTWAALRVVAPAIHGIPRTEVIAVRNERTSMSPCTLIKRREREKGRKAEVEG